MNRNIACACIACAMAAAVGIAGAAAAPMGVFDAVVSLDTVDVRIEEEPLDRTVILDDERLNRTFSIENAGQDCYVRMRCEVRAPSKGLRQSGELLVQDNSNWAKAADGWTYYLPVLHDGETLHLAEAVSNPQGALWDGTGFDFESTLTVQAVQAASFQPDYAEACPWGDIGVFETQYIRPERKERQ